MYMYFTFLNMLSIIAGVHATTRLKDTAFACGINHFLGGICRHEPGKNYIYLNENNKFACCKRKRNAVCLTVGLTPREVRTSVNRFDRMMNAKLEGSATAS